MKHILSALVVNQPGVLAHISGMLASRAFNIESLAVGETEDPGFSRITFVVSESERKLEQVHKQLEKIVTVVKVVDFLGQDYVERDLMLVKVQATTQTRASIRELAEIFRGRIVNVATDHLMIEIAGQESKLNAFIDLVRDFGILEMVRTGRIALLRNDYLSVEDATHPTAVQTTHAD